MVPKKQRSLVISDNGKGFDMETISRGNGLNNIETRAKRCKYALSFTSAVGKGTRLEINLL